jgi:hypothetical protein
MIKIFALVIFLGLFSGACGMIDNTTTGDSANRHYGAKAEFRPNRRVEFPHFSLTYTGERRVSSAQFPRGFLYHDFKIETVNEAQTISWTSGTGDIGPTSFSIGGKKYDLELGMSDKLGKLAENELVVWEK